MEHELSDEQCDRIVALTMDKIAAKHNMHALDLNSDVQVHHGLRRSIVRAAYELGKLVPTASAPSHALRDAAGRVVATALTPNV
jgi:hypothetical protein